MTQAYSGVILTELRAFVAEHELLPIFEIKPAISLPEDEHIEPAAVRQLKIDTFPTQSSAEHAPCVEHNRFCARLPGSRKRATTPGQPCPATPTVRHFTL